MKLVQLTSPQRLQLRYDFAIIDDNIRHPYLSASQVVNNRNSRDYDWVFDTSVTIIIEELE